MRVDWVEVGIVLLTFLLAVSFLGWTWESGVIAAAMILFGYVSGDMLWDLWFPPRRK